MLKQTIKYTDFDDVQQEETFYFNLSRLEITELEVDIVGGYAKMLQEIVDTNDNKQLVAQFKRIILMAYGKKSADGKLFIKNPEDRDQFAQSAAFEELFMSMANSVDFAVAFLSGVLPKAAAEAMREEAAKNPTTNGTAFGGAPTPPTPPTS